MSRLEIRRLKEHEETFLYDLGFLPRPNTDPRFSYWELLGKNALEKPIGLHVPIIDAPTELKHVLKLVEQYAFMQGYRHAKEVVATLLTKSICGIGDPVSTYA